MADFIPLSVPNLKGNELKYVTHAVETEWVSTVGPYVNDFEKSIADYVGLPMAVSCQSGTAGLHIALQLMGVTRDDLVIVPSLTFIATVNPVRYCGADPVFMDCDDTLCMDLDKLEEFLDTECWLKGDVLFHKSTGRRIPALVIVHIFGNMADIPRLLDICKKYKLKLVEDAAEALGTKYTEGPLKGKFAGTFGDIGVYYFNGNKTITTGGGGMIVSRDEALLKEAKHLTTQAKSDELNFMHDEVGYNYRLTNLQAALGLAQMEQLEKFIEIKTENYEHYVREISRIPNLRMLPFREGIRSNHWFYCLYLEDEFPLKPAELIQLFKENSIQARPVWGLIDEQPPYAGSITYKLEKSRMYWEHVVNIPCSSNLTSEDVERVIEVLRNV